MYGPVAFSYTFTHTRRHANHEHAFTNSKGIFQTIYALDEDDSHIQIRCTILIFEFTLLSANKKAILKKKAKLLDRSRCHPDVLKLRADQLKILHFDVRPNKPICVCRSKPLKVFEKIRQSGNSESLW